MTYSFKKGLVKGLVSLLSIAGAFAAFAGLTEVSVWSLVEDNLRPLLGSLTVGGVITIAVNYLKIRSKQ